MIAGIMIENGIRYNTGGVTESAIRSSGNELNFTFLFKPFYKRNVFNFVTSVGHVHSRPILLFHVNHFDMDSVHHVRFDHRCDVAVVYYGLLHPIPLNRFDYDDNGLELADLIDNIPVQKIDKNHLI